MILTLELAPEIEAALNNEAARRGQSVTDYAARVLEENAKVVSARVSAELARRAAVDAIAGKYAHLGISSAAIRAERDKDQKREDRFNDRFEKREAA